MGRRISVLLSICLVVLFLDQGSKVWAVGKLTKAFEVEGAVTMGERLRAFWVMENLEPLRKKPEVVIPDLWRHRYLENPGAAWGVFGGVDPSVRLPFFRTAPLIAVGILLALYFRSRREQTLHRFGLAMIVAGALGNFIDRLARGYVIDFIDWHWKDSHWPTFNVADVAISVGMALVLVDARRVGKRLAREAREEAARLTEEGSMDSPIDEGDAAIVAPPAEWEATTEPGVADERPTGESTS